ncbi:hypothetical protein HK096_004361, partial [Nowakowskiella sp. JEL0078]
MNNIDTWRQLSPFSHIESPTRRRKRILKSLLKTSPIPETFDGSNNPQITLYATPHNPAFNVKLHQIRKGETKHEFHSRTNHELSVVQSLTPHPNIQPIYECITGIHTAYLIMGTAGNPSGEKFRDERDVWCTFKKLVAVVQHIHVHGWVHLHIDARSLWWRADSGDLILTDFTHTTRVVGTSNEIFLLKADRIKRIVDSRLQPPEVADAVDFCDPRFVDVYMIGAWLLDVVYGEPGWTWRDKIQEFNAGKGKSVDLDPFEWCIDDGFRTLLERMMAADPDKRPLLAEVLENEFVKRIEMHWHGMVHHEGTAADFYHQFMSQRTKLQKRGSSGITLAENKDISMIQNHLDVSDTDSLSSEPTRPPVLLPALTADTSSKKQLTVTTLKISDDGCAIVGIITASVPSKIIKVRHTFNNWESVERDIIAERISGNLFKFSIGFGGRDSDGLEFAVLLQSSIDGSEIWDNNSGLNYH